MNIRLINAGLQRKSIFRHHQKRRRAPDLPAVPCQYIQQRIHAHLRQCIRVEDIPSTRLTRIQGGQGLIPPGSRRRNCGSHNARYTAVME